ERRRQRSEQGVQLPVPQERHAEGGADHHGDQKIHSAKTCHLDSLHRWKGRARLTGTEHGNPDSLRRCKPDQVRGSALPRTLSTIGCSPVSWMTTTSLALLPRRAGQEGLRSPGWPTLSAASGSPGPPRSPWSRGDRKSVV